MTVFQKYVTMVILLTTIILLIMTGVKSAALYYVTPVELVNDTSYTNFGIKMGALVVKDSYSYLNGTHNFLVTDLVDNSVIVPVTYNGIMPDTFTDESEVVLEGIYTGQEFLATTVLTKCGSRYEATPDQL